MVVDWETNTRGNVLQRNADLATVLRHDIEANIGKGQERQARSGRIVICELSEEDRNWILVGRSENVLVLRG